MAGSDTARRLTRLPAVLEDLEGDGRGGERERGTHDDRRRAADGASARERDGHGNGRRGDGDLQGPEPEDELAHGLQALQ